MHLSGHRAIRVLAVFLVLALGITALVPMTARAAVQVTGVVNTCGGPLPNVPGATVTLTSTVVESVWYVAAEVRSWKEPDQRVRFASPVPFVVFVRTS